MRSPIMRFLFTAAVALAPAALALAANPGHNFGARGSRYMGFHNQRHEVNRRLAHQNFRIREGVASGRLTPAQAKQLEANDRSIRQQEIADRQANGGHLTAAERRQLNQEENANSTLIRDEKHSAPK